MEHSSPLSVSKNADCAIERIPSPGGKAISEFELRRLYPKYASFNIQKVGAITVLSVGSVVLDAPLRTWLIAYERKTVKLSTAEIAERRGRRSLRWINFSVRADSV